MKKYIVVKNPICGIYQVDIDLYDSEEDARLNTTVDEDDIYKIVPIEI